MEAISLKACMSVGCFNGQRFKLHTGVIMKGSLLEKCNDSDKGHGARKLVQMIEVDLNFAVHNLQNEVQIMCEGMYNLTQRMICIVWSLDVARNEAHGSLKQPRKRDETKRLNAYICFVL